MKHILLSLLCLTISACGFQPLYQDGGAGLPRTVSGVEVAPIADRLGQQMRFRLQERFDPTLNGGSAADYRLTVSLSQEVENFGIKPDTAATQEQLTVTAIFSLESLSDGKMIVSDTYVNRTSYDIVLSDFATVVQREDSARRLAYELADRIHRKVAFTLADKTDEAN